MLPPPISQPGASAGRVAAFGALVVATGFLMYWVFAGFTNFPASFLGIPVGLVIGQIVHHSSYKRGGPRYQMLAAVFSFVAFDLTYLPLTIENVFREKANGLALAFYFLLGVIGPFLDQENGIVSLFMTAAGMYLASVQARARRQGSLV